MKSRKEKKPRPSKIGRRTGVDVVQGKKIRRQDDGTDVFEDYWTDNESVNSNQTTQSIQSPVKSRRDMVTENVSILDGDSVSFRNAPRSSMKRSQRIGEHEDHNSHSRSEHLRRLDVSEKENHLEIGRRTGGSVIKGKKIRRQDDGTDVYDDYWTDYDSKRTSQSIRSSVDTRSKRISESMSASNKDSVDVMQTPTKYMRESPEEEAGNLTERKISRENRRSRKFEDHDDFSSPEQSKRSRVSREKSQLSHETMQTSDLMENGEVSDNVDSHMENSAIARSKMTQTSQMLVEIENSPSKNSTYMLNKSRKSSKADLSEGKINSAEKSLRISERSTTPTPNLLKNRQEIESIHSKNLSYLHNKSRKSSMANLSYGSTNSSVQKYPTEKSQRTSERNMMATLSHLENAHVSNTADLHRKTASDDTLHEDLLASKSLRRSSRYKTPSLSSFQNEQLKVVNTSAEKEYEFVEDHDDSGTEILESPPKKSRVSKERSNYFEDHDDYFRPEQSKRSGVSSRNSAIARSKMTQTSHSLDEVENTPSKNRKHTFNKSRGRNEADVSDGKINSSVQRYSTEMPPRSSERSIMPTPDLLENRQETESMHSKNRRQMHNKSRKSSMADLSKGNANSSIQKYSDKSRRMSESSTTENSDPLETNQEIESTPSKNKMQKSSRKSSMADLSNGNVNSFVQTEKSRRTSESSTAETPDPLENDKEIESVTSSNKMQMRNKSRKSSMADLSNRKANSSVQKYPTEKSGASESSLLETPDLLGNSEEIESIPSKNKIQMHTKSRKSSTGNLDNRNANSSVQKYSSEKSRTPESSTLETPDLLENNQEIESSLSKRKMPMHKNSRKSSMADLSNRKTNSSVQKYSTEKSQASERSTLETPDLLENNQEIESSLSKSKMQMHKNSRKSSMVNLSNGNVSSVQKHLSENSRRTPESDSDENPDPLENSQACSTAYSPVKTASQDPLQEKASSPCKGVRRSSRYRVPPLASWRNERLKFVKTSAEELYECVGVEGGQTEDDFAFQTLKKKLTSKVKKRKIVSWNKRQKNIPKNIKKTEIVDPKTKKTIELYLHRPFSSYEWTLPPNEPGIMICRAFKSLLITFGFLDIAGHSMKDKQVSPLDNLYFAVVKGTVKAEINKTSFNFQKGDSFIVPCGTFYSMTNETSTNALLSFCNFRVPFFNFQEKD